MTFLIILITFELIATLSLFLIFEFGVSSHRRRIDSDDAFMIFTPLLNIAVLLSFIIMIPKFAYEEYEKQEKEKCRKDKRYKLTHSRIKE